MGGFFFWRVALEGGRSQERSPHPHIHFFFSSMFTRAWVSLFSASLYQHSINERKESDSPALHVAVLENSLKAVEFLLSDRVPINKTNKRQETALHWACRSGNLKMVELLLRQGASPSQEDCRGNTPVHWAAQYNASKIIRMLCAAGGSSTSKNNKGLTPLEVARLYSSASAANVLRKLQRVEMKRVEKRMSRPSMPPTCTPVRASRSDPVFKSTMVRMTGTV